MKHSRALGLAATAAMSLAALAVASAGGQESIPVLRYGMTEAVIEGASPNDARAASLLWAEGIANALGLYKGAEAAVYPTAVAATAAANSASADMIAMSTLEYFSVEKDLKMLPVLVWKLSDDVHVDYVLLARRGTGGLATSNGKSAVVYASNRPWALSEIWLDVLLADAGIQNGTAALASIKYVRKGQASMAVFFGHADFAIESGSAFDTAVNLNPQLGRELEVLARSPKLLPGVVLLTVRMTPDLRRRYVERATQLHELVRYRQAFMVLRVTELVAWDPGFLDSARALVTRHRRIQGRN